MLPALARRAIETYSDPGALVVDPMCGIGTCGEQHHQHLALRSQQPAHAHPVQAGEHHVQNHNFGHSRSERRQPLQAIAGDRHLEALPSQRKLSRTTDHRVLYQQFATLTAPDLPHTLDGHVPQRSRRPAARDAHTTAATSCGHGSNKTQTVGAAGFEPAVSSPQTTRDNQASLRPVAP